MTSQDSLSVVLCSTPPLTLDPEEHPSLSSNTQQSPCFAILHFNIFTFNIDDCIDHHVTILMSTRFFNVQVTLVLF